ncbi:uncharacterized protein F4822DRAFT_435293 [Hypoxylon trugodes]|uniref:uncharacterized protein n=1 Tax=Hypoxylon trugodes TaxID=326681 RepID=UPI002192D280|nr:uncharacterized protein F4822DRAFT_435293 [Hypoxylon trugodes]KAI1382618.1 hypothetical protein F4822DRAFT_435293 [Hypoxylon trugodes]
MASYQDDTGVITALPKQKPGDYDGSARMRVAEKARHIWVFVELAPEIEPETVPTYEKTEMTSTDVDVALHTLWSRSNDIPCKPMTRVSFHAMVLLAAIGGFRPGTLMNLTSSQFQVAVLHHPENPGRTKIIVIIGIRRNKIKETSKTSCLRAGGALSSALQNHILFHTTSVFESSYQSHRVRADLMSLAFGNEAGRNEQLFAIL